MTNVVLIQKLPEKFRKLALDIDKKGNNNVVIDTKKEKDELNTLGKKYDKDFDIAKYMTNMNKSNDIRSDKKMTIIDDQIWIKKYSKGNPGRSFYNASTPISKFDGYDIAAIGDNHIDKIYDKDFQLIGTHYSGHGSVTVTDLDAFIESGLVNQLTNEYHEYKGVEFNVCQKLVDGCYIFYDKGYGINADAAEPVAYVNQKGEIVDYNAWRNYKEVVIDFGKSIIDILRSLW